MTCGHVNCSPQTEDLRIWWCADCDIDFEVTEWEAAELRRIFVADNLEFTHGDQS